MLNWAHHLCQLQQQFAPLCSSHSRHDWKLLMNCSRSKGDMLLKTKLLMTLHWQRTGCDCQNGRATKMGRESGEREGQRGKRNKQCKPCRHWRLRRLRLHFVDGFVCQSGDVNVAFACQQTPSSAATTTSLLLLLYYCMCVCVCVCNMHFAICLTWYAQLEGEKWAHG